MDITVNELEPCKLDVHYKVNSNEIEPKLAEVVGMFKTAPISGFRRGKAPVKIIKQKYKKQINEALKRALVEEAYHNILFEKNLSAIGHPQVGVVNLFNNNFECSMVLHVKPSFDIKPYNEYVIPKPHVEMTSDDLTEKMLEDLRYRYGTANQYTEEDFVQNGDSVIVNYTGSIDNEIMPNLSADGEMMTVGASKLLEFDNNVLGMKLDEERTFNVVVPNDGLPSLIGKTIVFKVTLLSGSKIIPMPLDDSLAQKLNKSDFISFRSMVNASAVKRIEEMNRAKIIEALSNKLVADYDFIVPNWLLLAEAQQLAASSRKDWNKLADLDKEQFLDLAAKNVKLSLILDKIRTEDPDAQLTEEEVYNVIKQTLIAYSNGSVNDSNIGEHMNKLISGGQYQVLAAKQMDEHVINHILKLSKIVD